MAQRIVVWDDTAQRFIRSGIDPATVGAIPDTIIVGSVIIPNAATAVSYAYPSPFTNLDYSLQINFTNTIDLSVLFQPAVIIAKTINGFTARWPVPVDTGNYKLDFQAVVPFILYTSNVESIQNAASQLSLNSAYNQALPLVGGFSNLTDNPATSIVYQTDVLTDTNSTFTPKWNVPMDTGNYLIDWNSVTVSSSDRKSGVVSLPFGSTSISVNYIFPTLNSAVYSLIPRFENVVDGSVIYQAITVTTKTLTGFTAEWNLPLDTNNYRIKWTLNRIV